jgi:hypothetical protein
MDPRDRVWTFWQRQKFIVRPEVANRLLDGQARNLTTVIYVGIFKFLKHEYIYI